MSSQEAHINKDSTTQQPQVKKSLFKEIVGRYATGDFWLSVIKTIFSECISAFMAAVAKGVLDSFRNSSSNQTQNNGFYSRSFSDSPPPPTQPPAGFYQSRPTPTGSEQKSYPIF